MDHHDLTDYNFMSKDHDSFITVNRRRQLEDKNQ